MTRRVRTEELAGPALDWSVALALSMYPIILPSEYGTGPRVFVPKARGWLRWRPSTDWAQGGVLIDQHMIHLRGPQFVGDCWQAWIKMFSDQPDQAGATALEAVCRTVIATLHGGQVWVPSALDGEATCAT